MTPFRNDAQTSFDRDPPWPPMPQAALGFRRLATDGSERPWPRFESLTVGQPDEDDHLDDEELVWFDSCPDLDEDEGADAPGFEADLEAEPAVTLTPLRPPLTPPRRRVRLTPLIGATAVGVGGLLALFLLIGGGPDEASAQAAPTSASASSAQVGR